ncbi:hypothetical protein [Conexibacter arvalis]|uniref:Galactose mutarotase-like enzyme n=1 Tax=Conexibacter arvalis TaxID=912552 RepID=A0A840IBW3_9ACTN|nr:hypothetical protein [Conexibacter arvalis]MBB4662417.1 galactose mutarotase-like enzyme [Conexibacter arvalis]
MTVAGERELANAELRVRCAPAHGFAITSIVDLRSGAEALWQRAGHEPARCTRALGPSGAASDATFADLFVGGWFTMFPDVGYPPPDDPSSLMHGELARLPWEELEATPTEVVARVRTVRRPFEVRRRVALDGPRLLVEERIENVGAAAAPFAWGHHPCFSRATFAGGRLTLDVDAARVPEPASVPACARLRAGAAFAWPRAPRADGGAEDVSIVPARADGRLDHVCLRLRAGVVRLTAPAVGRALALTFDAELFEHALLWQNLRAPVSPFWGGADTFAVELSTIPGRGMREAEAARAVRALAPGAVAATTIALRWEELAAAARPSPPG